MNGESRALPSGGGGLRAWLLSDTPGSVLQARCQRLYIAWLEFSKNPIAMTGLVIIGALVIIALFAPWIASGDGTKQVLSDRLLPPSAEHWLGTDQLGRDIFDRIILGSRITLYIVGLVAVIVVPIGLLVGTVAGYVGGWVDAVLMRVTDIFLAFPRLILALAFVSALGPGLENAVLAIALTTWSPFARIARAETLTIRSSEHILAARMQGASTGRILFYHVTPLCLSSVIVRLTLDMAGIILTAAGLGFPWPRRSAAAAGMGCDDLHRTRVSAGPVVGADHSRHCHPGGQHGLQPAGRRASRRAGSEEQQRMSEGAGHVRSLLRVDDLHVTFETPKGRVEAVRGISFELGQERLGIVGESGSGKSQTGRAILGLTAGNGRVTADRIDFDGIDLLRADTRTLRAIRGDRISMIMQDPRYSLNPVMTVGEQIAEAYLVHARASRREAYTRSIEMLERVRIREPAKVYNLYPHEVSGGMGQRIMVAMMLIPDPDIIIADEPTSALDVTVQMQVLAILDDMVRERGMGLIFISHDLNLVASFCDRVLVMYGGQIMETLDAGNMQQAQHAYTRGLLNCLPHLDHGGELAVLERDPAWLEAPGGR